jgi:spermidine/putrescine transport system substrate-binding protein
MMSDLLDLGNFGMIRQGINPEKSGPAGWRRAARALAEQRDAGLVRGYYQQEYIDILSKGETWISMAWSGDVFLQNLSSGTDLRFVIPREGGNMWTDNMMIPRHAQNPVDAMMLMDWYYRPEIAAMLTEAINFIPPCPPRRPLSPRTPPRRRAARRRCWPRSRPVTWSFSAPPNTPGCATTRT